MKWTMGIISSYLVLIISLFVHDSSACAGTLISQSSVFWDYCSLPQNNIACTRASKRQADTSFTDTATSATDSGSSPTTSATIEMVTSQQATSQATSQQATTATTNIRSTFTMTNPPTQGPSPPTHSADTITVGNYTYDQNWFKHLPFPPKKQQHRQSIDNTTVPGTLITVLSFTVGMNQDFCFNLPSQVQVAGKGLAVPNQASKITFRLTSTTLVYSLNDQEVCLVNVDVGTRPLCHCPGGSSSCDSSSNMCNRQGLSYCVNYFKAGVKATGCFLEWTGQTAQLCSSVFFNAYSYANSYKVSTTYIKNHCFTSTHAYSDGTVIHSGTYCNSFETPFSFNGDDGMVTIVGQFDSQNYGGNDRITMDTVPRVTNTWNEPNEYDTTKGCWAKSVNGRLVYDTLKMGASTHIEPTNCNGDQFSVSTDHHKSNPAMEQSLVQNLAAFGSFIIDESHYTLTLTPNVQGNYLVTLTTNVSDISFSYQLVGVSDFSCVASVDTISGGSLICSTSSAELSGTTRFTLNDPTTNLELYSLDLDVTPGVPANWTVPMANYGLGGHYILACMMNSIGGYSCQNVTFTESGRIVIYPNYVYNATASPMDTQTSSLTLNLPTFNWSLFGPIIGASGLIVILIIIGIFITLICLKPALKVWLKTYCCLPRYKRKKVSPTNPDYQPLVTAEDVELESYPDVKNLNIMPANLSRVVVAKPEVLANQDEIRNWNKISVYFDDNYQLPNEVKTMSEFYSYCLNDLYTIPLSNRKMDVPQSILLDPVDIDKTVVTRLTTPRQLYWAIRSGLVMSV